ncbi:MAG TPA: type II toxin-antitoxin system HipA family toxin [Oculatellaceae cyanobacterium]
MADELQVYLRDHRVGWLKRTQFGITFAYDVDAEPEQISFCLPVQRNEFSNMATEAYFGGLLPENPLARQAIARQVNANANDTFSLLRAIGRECAGAVSVVPVGEIPPSETFIQPEVFLDESELERAILDLPRSPFFMDRGARLSLAGFQGKACVVVDKGRIGLPEPSSFSTHILKPDIRDEAGSYRNLVQNEFLCLRLAQLLKIPAAKATMGRAKTQTYLLVERYDRSLQGGFLRRLHQEDFCQALGFMSASKYEIDGGPGYKRCFDLIDDFTLPAKDEITFLKYLIFNYLTGNADAHGKNYSVVHSTGTHKLAPLYDTVATSAFADLSNKMAMSIGGEYSFLDVKRSNWEKLSEEIMLGFRAVKLELIRQAKKLPILADEQRQTFKTGPFDSPSLDHTVSIIRSICEHTLSTIE